MQNNIKELKKEFNKIKNLSLNKSLRSGTTGIGYTFETLLNKQEDSSYHPDFKGIEIKTQLGYTKSALTLFTLTPIKNNDRSTKYILENFGYPDKNNKGFKTFKGDVFYNKNNLIAYKYIFKTKIDYKRKILRLIILNCDFEVINESIYWNLSDIKERLFTKLNYLAYIKGYPYKKDNEIYYKYTNINIYKLKDFNIFLELLKKDIIYIKFNISIFKNEKRYGQIQDRGTAFLIKNSNLNDLFDIIE